MANEIEFLVRFGRVDGSAVKTIFEDDRKKALHLANSLSYLLFKKHNFKTGEFKGPTIRFSDEVFWVELKSQYKGERSNGNS